MVPEEPTNPNNLVGRARLLQPNGLLDGDFVKGIDRHHHVGEFDARAVGPCSDLHAGVDGS